MIQSNFLKITFLTFYSCFIPDLLLFIPALLLSNLPFISYGKFWKTPHILEWNYLFINAHVINLLACNSLIPSPLHKIIAINIKLVDPATTMFVIYTRQIFDKIVTGDELNYSRITKPICAITQYAFSIIIIIHYNSISRSMHYFSLFKT